MTAITAETTEERFRVSAETRPAAAAESSSRDSRVAQAPVTPVSGIVDVSDGRGYLRTGGYRRSPGDIPLTTSQVRQYGLRKGDEVEGTVTAAGKAGGNGSGSRNRQRSGAGLASVTAINGLPPEAAKQRP